MRDHSMADSWSIRTPGASLHGTNTCGPGNPPIMLDKLSDIAYEKWHSWANRDPASPVLTWPLDPEALAALKIHWPTAYQWPTAAVWMDSLLPGLKKFVKIEPREIPQPYKGIVLIEASLNGETHEVAIDYSDYSRVDEACVSRCPVYFKMQHRDTGYPFENVIPGGFVPGSHALHAYLPSLRATRDRRQFSYDVYGRFSLKFASEVRKKATSLLRNQNQFHYEGGGGICRYSRYLQEVARSKICIDLPGNGDLCFRLIDYLAIGSCIIGPKPAIRLHVPLEDRKHVVYTKNDLSDMLSLVTFYLENDDAREQLQRNSREYFDLYLRYDQIAAYYLTSLLARLL